MSSTINNGSQTLTFDYRQEGTSEGFNKLLYTLIPQGIIKGGALSTNSGLVVNIAPMTCYYKDTTNEVGVRIETSENATVTVSQSKPYVVGDFTWINTEDNFLEFKSVDSPTSTQIVFGRAIFENVSNISGYDYTYKTWSREYYESLSGDGEIPFKVTVTPTNQLKLNVGKGKAIINGKEVVFNETVTSAEINTNISNGYYSILCITDNGQLTFINGVDDASYTLPTIPYNCMAIAKMRLSPNPTSLLGLVEYIYNNHFQSTSVDTVVDDLTNHIANTNNPHSVTATQLGLGNVVNTSDSSTPTENGTQKFTTGGAYALDQAKQNKITNTVQNDQPTDSNYVSGFTNSSTSTNPTATNSWTFTNVWNWIKTKIGVRSGTTDSAIGSSTKPVYFNSNGKAIALSDNNANVNLESTQSANLFSSNPSFGVSGILGVSHGGTGTSTFTSGSVLVGNGTNAITTKAIDTVPTENSSNLITSGGVYNHFSKFKVKYFNFNKNAYNLKGYQLYDGGGYRSTYASLYFNTNTSTTSTLEYSDFPNNIFGDIFLTIFCNSTNSQTLNVYFYYDTGDICYIRNIITNQSYTNTSFTLSLSHNECAILIGFVK